VNVGLQLFVYTFRDLLIYMESDFVFTTLWRTVGKSHIKCDYKLFCL